MSRAAQCLLAGVILGAGGAAQEDATPAFRLVDRPPPAAPEGAAPRWAATFDAALAAAKRADKRILLYFSAVW